MNSACCCSKIYCMVNIIFIVLTKGYFKKKPGIPIIPDYSYK